MSDDKRTPEELRAEAAKCREDAERCDREASALDWDELSNAADGQRVVAQRLRRYADHLEKLAKENDEATDEKPLPCISCGGRTYVSAMNLGRKFWYVRCQSAPYMHWEGHATQDRSEAIRRYNEVARAVEKGREEKTDE